MKNIANSLQQFTGFLLLTAILLSLMPVATKAEYKRFKLQAVSKEKVAENSLVDSVEIAGNVQVNEDVGIAIIGVTRSGDVGDAFSVNYATENGTATAANDYTATSGVLNFVAGENTKQISVPIINDSAVEDVEWLFVNLTNATNGVIISASQGEIDINIDDPFFEITNYGNYYPEGDSPAQVSVNRYGNLGNPATVNLATSNGTAIAGSDYVAQNITLNFAANESGKIVSIPLINDSILESDENFNVTISNPSAGNGLGASTQVQVIINDDDQAYVSIQNPNISAVQEGSPIVFNVVRSGGISPAIFSVNYATSNLTATAGTDYVAQSGTINFAAGETQKTISVATLQDGVAESNESFRVTLSSPTNGVFVTGSPATGSITDNITPVYERLAFVSKNAPTDIFAVNDDATGFANLTNTTGESEKEIDYNKNVGKIIFACEGNLCVMNHDGTNRLTLYDDSTYEISEPGWSANAQFIVFSGSANNLGVYDVAANSTVWYSTGSVQPENPTYSPDGTKILFSDKASNSGEIYTINANGTNLLNVSNNTFDDVEASWSPDGTKIVFQRCEFNGSSCNAGEIFTMNADGTNQVNLTNSIANDDESPMFSPDGSKIAFSSNGSISLMNANGTSPQTFGLGKYPGWSPSGAKIAFYRSPELRAMNADGTNDHLVQAITADDIADAPVTWLPVLNYVAFTTATTTVSESNTGTSFTAKRGGDLSTTFTVDYATADVTATAGQDYTATSGTLTFAPNETSKTISVPILNDTIPEPSETFTFSLSNPSNSTFILPPSVNTVTIADDEPVISAAFSPATFITEGNNGTITLTRSGSLTASVSVNVSTADNTATAGLDYNAVSQTVTFAPNETSKTVTVTTINDALGESDESFYVNFTNLVGANLSGSASRLYNISDNEPRVSFNPWAYNVQETAGSVTITARRSNGLSQTATVSYETVDINATGGYTHTTGTLTFTANQTSKTFTVPIIDNTNIDPTRSFYVRYINPSSNTSIATDITATATVNIIDNDSPVSIIEVSPATRNITRNEGQSAEITINRSGALSTSVSVSYATVAPATAEKGLDYTLTNGTVTFAVNETAKTIAIPIIDDSVPENSEYFTFLISNATNGGTFGDSASRISTVTINANDRVVVSAVSPPIIAEGAGLVSVQLLRSEDLTIPSTVSYATQNVTAIAGNDYTAVSGTVSFAAGEVSKTISIPILNDAIRETPSDETFELRLSSPSVGTFLANNATVTIFDDDIRYKMTNSLNTSVNEGDGTVSISVTKMDSLSLASSVNYQTTNGTAVSPIDFTGGTGTLTFAPGESVKNISIPIVQDVASEPTETFTVTIVPSANAIINSPSNKIVSIIDDDPKIAMEFSSVNVNEIDGTIALKILRIGPTDLTASVNYSTSNGTAIAGSDYTSVSGTATFNAGESEKIISVPILVDNIPETDQSFNFLLSNPNGAILQSPTSTTIVIREPVTTFSLSKTKPECAIQTSGQNSFVICSDYSPRFRWEYVETTGTAGTFANWSRYFDLENQTTQTVTVTRSGGRINEAASVNYTTSNGTAISGEDFTFVSGTLDFAPNEVSKTFDVPILNDSIGEGYEYLNITLSSPTNQHTLGKSTVRMGILDSYVGFSTFDNNGSQIEHPEYGNFETSTFGSVPVYRLGDVSNSLTINYLTANGTATPDEDYTSTSGTLTFAAGETVKFIDVPILNQPELEGTENFEIQLSDAIGDGSIVGNLTNFSIYETFAYIPCYQPSDRTELVDCRYGDYRNIVASESAANVQVKVRVNGERNGAITVDYATSDETATAGNDYSATNGTLTFAVNESEKFITVPILNDSIAESDETFKVSLSNLQGSGGILESNSVSTIRIQDACVRFTADSVSETNSQTTIVVARQCDTASALTVGYSTADDTAIAGQDYTATNGTVTFAVGETSKSFTIPILDDNILEQPERINLVMNLSGTEAVQHPQSSTFVQINESLSTVSVGVTALSVDENAGFYTALVSRSGNVNQPFSVDYTTLDGTAIAGSDYTAVNGTLNFAAGELQKTFQVPILNDFANEPNESFIVNLSNLTGETVFGNSSRSISITDDDTAPKFKFQFPSFTINEAGGNGQIRIVRTGDPTTAVSVNIATSNGTATAGSDYTTTSATLNFASNETVKAFNVPILDDAVTEGNEYLNLTLSSPIGGTIETPNPVRLNISEIKPQVQLPNWTLNVVSSGGLLSGRHLAGIAFNSTNKDVYVATDTGQLQNTEELYFDLFKIEPSGNQTQIGNYLIPHYDLVNLEFNPTDGQIYVAGTDKTVYRINPANGAISVFNSNLGVTFFRNGLEFNAAGELIFMPEGNPNSFYRVNTGSGLTLLGNVVADNNSNYGTRFGIQPDGDYIIYPDGDAASNPRITQVKPNSFDFSYLSPTNVRTLGSAFGHSIGAINSTTGDIFSSGGNFGKGSSVILLTTGASSLSQNADLLSGETVPFITNIGNGIVDGQNNLTATGVIDLEFGARRDNLNGYCLYFADDVDDTIYQSCITTSASAAKVSLSGRVVTANGKGIRNAVLQLTSAEGKTFFAKTNPFGYYRFENIPVGTTVIAVTAKRFTFNQPTKVINLDDNATDIDFTALE